MFDLDSLVMELRDGRMTSFRQFIDRADGLIDQARPACSKSIATCMPWCGRAIPPPSRLFGATSICAPRPALAAFPADAPLDRMLAEQVCITQEVRELALWLRRRGCLVMTMSDKPDEATLPTPELAAQGYQPLHRLQTVAVGESIFASLA